MTEREWNIAIMAFGFGVVGMTIFLFAINWLHG